MTETPPPSSNSRIPAVVSQQEREPLKPDYNLLNRILNPTNEVDAVLSELPDWTRSGVASLERFCEVLSDRNYTFKSLDSFQDTDLESRTFFFRYDVHLHDIAAAIALAREHERLKLPAVFYITWKFSEFEDASSDYFRFLKKFDQQFVQFGLHAAPASTHFLLTRYENNRKAAREYVKSQAFADELGILADQIAAGDEEKRTELIRHSEATLKEISDSFRNEFGSWRTITGHGNLISTNFAAHLSAHPKLDILSEIYEPVRFLTPERIKPHGYHLEATTFPADSACVLWDGRPIPDTVKRINRMTNEGKGMVFLLHPLRVANWIFDQVMDTLPEAK